MASNVRCHSFAASWMANWSRAWFSSAVLRSVTSRSWTSRPATLGWCERSLPTASMWRQDPSRCRKRKSAEAEPEPVTIVANMRRTVSESSGWMASSSGSATSSSGR